MKELLKKLAAFQQDCPVISKDSESGGGGNFTYHYADLPSIFAVINPLLDKHGLMITQPLEFEEGVRFIKTVLYHLESGEKLESRIDIPEVSFKQMNDYQALGSGITYMRRYALSALLGIVTDKDSDAPGKQRYPKAEKHKFKPADSRPHMNEKQFAAATQRIKDADPYVNIDDGADQIPLTPSEFLDRLTGAYQMKDDHKEALIKEVNDKETLGK